MGKPTLQDRIVRYLIKVRSAIELPSSSRKYRQLTRGEVPWTYYFVGHCGAIRVGRCISKSQSFTDNIMPKVKAWEKEN